MSSPLTPAPGTPQTADKAKTAATVGGLLAAALMALALYFDGKNGTSYSEMVLALLGGLGTAGATGFATFNTRNKSKDPL